MLLHVCTRGNPHKGAGRKWLVGGLQGREGGGDLRSGKSNQIAKNLPEIAGNCEKLREIVINCGAQSPCPPPRTRP